MTNSPSQDIVACNCIADINTKLDGQCLNASMFGVRRVAIDLIRTDKWVSENRRTKPKLMLATFCPFCGEKYPAENADARGAA